MAGVLIYPSLDSLEAVVGICDQQSLRLDCADMQAIFAGCTGFIVSFVMSWLKFFFPLSMKSCVG